MSASKNDMDIIAGDAGDEPSSSSPSSSSDESSAVSISYSDNEHGSSIIGGGGSDGDSNIIPQNTNDENLHTYIALAESFRSLPGAFRVEGPNYGNSSTAPPTIEEDDNASVNGRGFISIDVNPNHNNGDDDEEEEEDIHLVREATPVNPIRATILPHIPLYEGTIVVDDKNDVVEEDKEPDDDMVGNIILNAAAKRRNRRTELVKDIIVAAENGRSSSSLGHQLNLSNMKLHGQEHNMNLLNNKLLELKRREEEGNLSSPEIIFISGVSGIGKSTLVVRGINDRARELGLAFCGGKFDLNRTPLPFSAFVDAMVSLTHYIIEKKKMHMIQSDINEALDEGERMLLVRALPGCENLFPLQQKIIYHKRASRSSSITAEEQYETLKHMGKEAIARLHHKIKKLLQIICKHLDGLVLFIDDLQFSDTATIDLLQSILLDFDIASLLLVGAYRDDEVSCTHPLAHLIHEMDQTSVIKIDNLTLEHSTALVAEALEMDEEVEIQQLGVIIQKKTRGNPFFILMFLRSLVDKGMLKYDIEIKDWTWNNMEVNAKDVTNNVANILVDKLNRLGESQKNIIMIAGSLGGCFSKSIICTIVTSLSEKDTDQLDWHETLSSIDESIDELEKEGILEKDTNENVWRFSHDRIQLAAFELIPPNDRDSFRGEIGNILLEQLDDDALEANLFKVVSLRNFAMATISDDDDRRGLAQMNLRAGMKASGNAAFDSAAAYFKAGRAVLGPNGWSIDQNTMLTLSCEAANACFISGHHDTMHELITEVITRQDISIEDKFNVIEVRIQAAHVAKDFKQGIDIALDFREQLGLPTIKNEPASKLVIIKEFIKSSRALGNKTAEDIARLPNLTDDRVIMGQRMLELLCTSTSQDEPTMFPLIVFLMIEATLKYGINASSCDALSSFALLCGPFYFRRPREERKMLHALDLILSKPGMERSKARSIYINEGVIHHWSSPLQDTLEPFLEGYQIGLRTGDVESAGINLAFRINHLYYTGRPLKDLKHQIETMINAMIQMNQTQATISAKTMLLVVKKLLGETNDVELKGIIEDAKVREDKLNRAKTYTNVLDLKVFFNQWDEAASLLLEAGDCSQVLGHGVFTLARFTYLEGLISIQSAKSATTWLKKRTWKNRSIKSKKRIRTWVKKGNVNLVHYLHLLEAEYATMQGGKSDKAECNYKAAIDISSRYAFIQDCALSHELASTYYDSKGDTYWRDYHMEQCKKYYSEWNATAKLKQLNDDH